MPVLASNTNTELWLLSPEQIDPAWKDIYFFVEKGLRFCRGEISVRDVYKRLCTGDMHAFMYVEKEEVKVVMVMEFVYYPQFHSARIVSLAGRGLRNAVKYLSEIENWCLLNGAVEIEAWVRPAIRRLLDQQRLAFDPVYICVSRNLRSKLQ